MTIRINGAVVELPADLNFDYFEENRLFTDADGYSLEIELPLQGSATNRAIFGYIELNPPSSETTWPMVIECGAVNRVGMAVLTGIGDGTVKVQFLSGRSEQNFEKKMNEYRIIDICTGDFQMYDLPTPYQALKSYDEQKADPDNGEWSWLGVALPWVNLSTGARQNDIKQSSTLSWGPYISQTGLSWMPYLLNVALHVARGVGYSADFSEWENSHLRNLIVCNATPIGLQLQRHYEPRLSLPDWTALEFFRNIEPLLGGEFDIDHQARRITFRDSSKLISGIAPVELTDVEDEFEITSTFGQEQEDGRYVRTKKYRYATPNVDGWAFYDCPWYEPTVPPERKLEYTTAATALEYMKPLFPRRTAHQQIVKDIYHDAWFMFYNRVIDNGTFVNSTMQVRNFNLFGPSGYDFENPDETREELKVLPVMIADGVIQLNPNCKFDLTADLQQGTTEDPAPSGDIPAEEAEYYQTPVADAIESGEPEHPSARYEHLFVGYWDGWSKRLEIDPLTPSVKGFRFHVDMISEIKTCDEPWSMRINAPDEGPYGQLPAIDEAVKYTYWFLSATLPNPRAVYYIKGKKYLCRRLSAQITADGMSRRVKGEFYRLKE